MSKLPPPIFTSSPQLSDNNTGRNIPGEGINQYRKEGGKHFYWLDLLRFAAAFIVMAGHCRGSFFTEYSLLPENQHTLPTFIFYFITRLGYESVLIFFILSGFLVGGKALSRIADGSFQFRNYAIDRFARIMLPLVSALLFYLPIRLYFDSTPISPLAWLGNLVGLQGVLTGFVFGPLWSLSYEIWFYIIMFAVALTYCSVKNSATKWYVGIILLFLSLLVFTKLNSTLLFVWLLGALFFVKFPSFSMKTIRFWCIISAAVLALLIVLLQLSSGSHAVDSEMSDNNAILRNCLTIAFGFASAIFVRTIIEFIPTNKIAIKINKLGTKLAAFSYTLYLVHTPVFRLLENLGAPKSETITITSVGLYILWLATATIIAYLLYLIFEKNTPLFKKWLKTQLIK